MPLPDNEPSVEEIVAQMESIIEMEPVTLRPSYARLLIASWRERGEALERIVNRVPWQGRKDFGPGDEGLADYWAWVAHEQLETARAALKDKP
jgi:hypothetical protein